MRMVCGPSDQLIASAERQVTIIMLTIGPIVGRLLVSEVEKFLSRGSRKKIKRKKIETRDSRVSLTSPVSNKCIAVRKVATPLRELTCHIGSHSVTCHSAEVTFPPLPQPKLVLD